MHRSLLAVAALGLIAVLLVSMNAGPLNSGGVATHPARTEATWRTAAGGTVRVGTVDPYGGATSSFSPGLYSGEVYFYAYDPSDSRATVTITDQNSSRDGVPVPADRWVVTFNSSTYPPYTNLSTTWGAHYQLPFSLTSGGTWNISINGTNGGSYSTSFTVSTYYVSTYSDRSVYLPGEPAVVSYRATATVNGSPIASVRSVQATASYRNINNVFVPIFSGSNLADAVTGNLSLTMPVNASRGSRVVVTVYMNQSGNISEEATAYLYAGILQAPVLNLYSCPDQCATGVLAANSVGILAVNDLLTSNGPTEPAAGATVHFAFRSGGIYLTNVPGSPPATTTTNTSGETSVAFVANTTVFLPTKVNGVLVSVTDPWYLNETANSSLNFSVAAPTPGIAGVTVVLNQGQYYSGDSVSATWTIGGYGTNAYQGYHATQWFAYASSSGDLLALGTLTSSSATGQLQFRLPSSFTGAFSVVVDASNQTGQVGGVADATVAAPALLITPSELEYNPGDTLTFQVTPQGSVFQGATLWMSLTGGSSATPIAAGTMSGSSFSYTVPRGAVPASLTFSVVAQSSSLGILATNQISVTEASGYALVVGIATSSQYVDGSFQPGESVQISYSILSYGAPAPSQSYSIEVLPIFSATGAGAAAVTAASGSIAYTLPSNSPAGIQLFEVIVRFGQCSTGGACSTTSLLSILVNPSPSILGYELGAGSGVTVGWTLLLGLIVVVALLLVLMIRRRRPYATPLPPVVPADLPSSPPEASSPSASPPPGATGEKPWEEAGSARSPGTAPDPNRGSPPLPNPPPRT